MSAQIITYNAHEYKELCDEMRSILRLEKELAHRKKQVRSKIIELSGGDRLEHGIKVTRIICKGSVDIEKIVEDFALDEADIEEYRKSSYEKWDVRSY